MASDNANRMLLLDHITGNPGTSFRELTRATDMAAGTARHHLTVLARCGMIREERHRNTLRFFRSDSRFATDWSAYVVLRAPEMRRLHDWILANPRRVQKDILEVAEGWGWSRSTTQHRLTRLVEEDLAVANQSGRCKAYTARRPGQTLPDLHPLIALAQATA